MPLDLDQMLLPDLSPKANALEMRVPIYDE